MKIEITHDSLAAEIYGRIADDEKARRKTEKFISDRYAMYELRKVLLTQDDIEYIHPNLSLVDIEEEKWEFVRKSKRALKRRRRVLALIVLLVFLILSGFALVAWNQRNVAIAAREEAVASAREAQRSAAEARQSASVARANESIAETQSEIANLQSEIANDARTESERQRQIAQRSAFEEAEARKEAVAAKIIADSARARAVRAQKGERSQRQTAEREKNKAEAAEKRAVELLNRSIAQSMAARSMQITNDTLGALVALKAFQINQKHGGRADDPLLHEALYKVNKRLKGRDFNLLEGHTSTIRELVVSDSGERLFSTSSDGKVLEWRLKTEQIIRTGQPVLMSRSVRRSLVINPENKWLIGGNDRPPFLQKKFMYGDTSSFVEINGPQVPTWSLVLDTSGKYLFGSGGDGSLWRYELDTDRFMVYSHRDHSIRKLRISPDNNSLLGVDDRGEVLVWDIREMAKVDLVDSLLQTAEGEGCRSICFSPDGSLLALGTYSGIVEIRSWPENQVIHTLRGHTARINDLTFSPDGTRLASAGYGGRVQLWSMDFKRIEQNLPIVFMDHKSWVTALTFTTDGQYLMTGDRDGEIRYWPVNLATMTKDICQKLQREMTQNEWLLYAGTDIDFELTCTDQP